jgi:hypothetical protein
VTTAAQWRKAALALPETQEKSHFGQPDFRVKNRIFAGLSRDGKRGTLKLGPEVQLMVVETNPEGFFPAPGAWGHKGWTHVVLARVPIGELKELLLEAWRLTAPKRLVLAHATGKPFTRRVRRDKRSGKLRSSV